MSVNKSQVNLENISVVQQKAEVVKKALSELIATKYKTAIKSTTLVVPSNTSTTYITENKQPTYQASESVVKNEIRTKVNYTILLDEFLF